MKNQTKSIASISLSATVLALAATWQEPARADDLLKRYPTTLTAGMLEAAQARPCQFTVGDIYQVSRFSFQVGNHLKIDTGPADLGIGHCRDGAVYAMLIPREGGKLTRSGAEKPEPIAHVWFRFHPGEINKLFPPATVSAPGARELLGQFRTIANGKFKASYHAGANAMIPEPKDMTVDVDTKGGPRRFFMVDTQAGKAEYVNAFEGQPVRIAGLNQGAAGAGGAPTPKILSTVPRDGATEVDPGLAEITVTFDQDMEKGFSWTGGGPEYPTSPDGADVHWKDQRTCVFPVKLEAGHHYRVGINSVSFRNFRSVAGESAEPASISFTTR